MSAAFRFVASRISTTRVDLFSTLKIPVAPASRNVLLESFQVLHNADVMSTWFFTLFLQSEEDKIAHQKINLLHIIWGIISVSYSTPARLNIDGEEELFKTE